MTQPAQDTPFQGRLILMRRWRRRTLLALIYSGLMSALAIGLFVVGVAIYFSDFSLGSGGDPQAVLIVVAALCLGLIAVFGGLYAIVAAWLTLRNSGSGWWLAMAVAVPLLELVAFAFVWRSL